MSNMYHCFIVVILISKRYEIPAEIYLAKHYYLIVMFSSEKYPSRPPRVYTSTFSVLLQIPKSNVYG